MSSYIPIHTLAAALGLTSRTLRHWESEGLFPSGRDADSGWRIYGEDAVLSIRIAQMLRQFDVPLKEIRTVTELKTFESLAGALTRQLAVLKAQREASRLTARRLNHLLQVIEECPGHLITESVYTALCVRMEQDSMELPHKEYQKMTVTTGARYRIVTLAPMRTVYNIATAISPEDAAMRPVAEWIKAANLTGTARFFGGNVPPLASEPGTPYGYGVCAVIPGDIAIPSHLKELTLPGGLFARLESGDDIGASWKHLMHLIVADGRYVSDRSRLCLEEHIRNDTPDGSGNEYSLDLLEPIKLRTR